ncbi:hypothetical protein [Microvirga massiliensis]|uniref:hypothetical protein n=1 Tax=Microvirga massiliensis TaxID=1033741 RepID=UPI00062BA49F|nr:hypothetical protein [Microvirga massiliensis]
MRWQIIDSLLSGACQDISFIADQIRIAGFLYRAVVDALRNPRHRIHITIDPSVEDKALGGEYIPLPPNSNRLIFPFAKLDGNVETLASRCEAVVHECTHACIDYTKDRVLGSEEEVASWFADALFRRGQGLPIGGDLDFRKNFRVLADDARESNVRGKTFRVPETALGALEADFVHVHSKRDKTSQKAACGWVTGSNSAYR